MRTTEFKQIRKPGHGAIRVQDLTDYAGRLDPGQTRKIHSRFGVPCPGQYAPGLRHDGKNVPGTHDILPGGILTDSSPNSMGPVGGRDTGTDPICGLD